MFSFQLISKYRSELMGYAILGVMVSHFIQYTGVNAPYILVASRLIYTQGLFFLSGFGLCCSLAKDNDVYSFYKKRIRRLVIPYLLISWPFILAMNICLDEGGVEFLSKLTTTSFWINGNYYGVWYIAVSLVLYFFTPCFYNYAFNGKKGIVISKFLLLFVAFILANELLHLNTDYYDKVGIWTGKALLFPIGMLVGYFYKNGIEMKRMYWCILTAIMVYGAYYFRNIEPNYNDVCKTVVAIPCLCVALELIGPSIVNNVLAWLGKYSLELFLVHLMIRCTMLYCLGTPEIYNISVGILVALLIATFLHGWTTNVATRFIPSR